MGRGLPQQRGPLRGRHSIWPWVGKQEVGVPGLPLTYSMVSSESLLSPPSMSPSGRWKEGTAGGSEGLPSLPPILKNRCHSWCPASWQRRNVCLEPLTEAKTPPWTAVALPGSRARAGREAHGSVSWVRRSRVSPAHHSRPSQDSVSTLPPLQSGHSYPSSSAGGAGKQWQPLRQRASEDAARRCFYILAGLAFSFLWSKFSGPFCMCCSRLHPCYWLGSTALE